MSNSLFFLISLGLYSSLASDFGIVNFLTGFSVGYDLGESCLDQLDGIDGEWFAYKETERDGSGAALTKLRDFTLYLTVAATECSLLEIANLLDSAFTTNSLATFLRFIASFQDISESWSLFWGSLLTYDYPVAGEAFGQMVKKLVG
jgi:hypothetical protein